MKPPTVPPTPGHDDATIEHVRDKFGYSAGHAAHCPGCGWYGDLRERPTQAHIDLLNHIRDTRET